jgi:two-component system sensor histidine kinase HydH
VVFLLSLGLIAITLLNYRTAVRVAEETLRNQGVGIGLEVAAEARGRGARDSEALGALISEQRRRAVAFLAILERDGTFLAHTNPRLAGTRLEDAAFLSVRDTGLLTGSMVTLATGEEVYELTLPFHIPPTGPGGTVDVRQPRFRILRLALHSAPARQIVYQAQAQVLFVGVLVLTLLGLSAWQIRTLRRYLTLQEEAARQERLAALGGMAAVLAHEILNPLGAIKGLAQFLGEKRSADSAYAEMTQTIAHEAARLERLVNDLLTYARPRLPDRQPTDLSIILGEVLGGVLPAAEAAGVVCRLDVSEKAPSITADPDQLKQLFGNLALNAVQAVPSRGKLTLALRPEDGRGMRRRAVEVVVEDTGSGIPEADLCHVFEPFYTTRTRGTGLGLAICRQIVEAHGGTIRVARTGPEGTTILVTLPVEGPAHA